MRLRVYVHTGYVGADHEDVIEIDDDLVEGMTGKDRNQMFEEEAQDFMYNNIEYGWEVLDEN